MAEAVTLWVRDDVAPTIAALGMSLRGLSRAVMRGTRTDRLTAIEHIGDLFVLLGDWSRGAAGLCVALDCRRRKHLVLP